MTVFRIRQKLTAADLNGINGEWKTWTPITWLTDGAGADPALGNGSLVGEYIQTGKVVWANLQLTIGSTTTLGSGAWTFSLPVSPSATSPSLIRFGQCLSLAGAYRNDVARIDPNDTVVRMIGISAGSFYSSTVPAAWANTNILSLDFWYKVT